MEKLSLTQEIIDSVRNVVEVLDKYALVKPNGIIPLDECSPARWIYNSKYAVSIEDWEKNVYLVLLKSFIKKVNYTLEASEYKDVMSRLKALNKNAFLFHDNNWVHYYNSVGYLDYENEEEYMASYFSMYSIIKFEIELDERINLNELEDDFLDIIQIIVNMDNDMEDCSVIKMSIGESCYKLELWCIDDGGGDDTFTAVDVDEMRELFIDFMSMISN